jgi:hypothetical protein
MSETPQQNGIAGVKKIKFDFEFTYSKGGDDDLGDTIVLKSPSFMDLDFNNHMTATVSKAMSGIPDGGKDDPDDLSQKVEPSPEEVREELRSRALSLMSIGLSQKGYNEYVKFLIKKLTNNNKYAHIEDEEIGITDLLWREIEAKGGKKAIQKILSEYTYFFIQDLMKEAA